MGVCDFDTLSLSKANSSSTKVPNLANWYHLGGAKVCYVFGYIYVSKARKNMMDLSGV